MQAIGNAGGQILIGPGRPPGQSGTHVLGTGRAVLYPVAATFVERRVAGHQDGHRRIFRVGGIGIDAAHLGEQGLVAHHNELPGLLVAGRGRLHTAGDDLLDQGVGYRRLGVGPDTAPGADGVQGRQGRGGRFGRQRLGRGKRQPDRQHGQPAQQTAPDAKKCSLGHGKPPRDPVSLLHPLHDVAG